VNILVPSQMKKVEQEEVVQRWKKWAVERMLQKPELIERLGGKEYTDGQLIEVGERTYQLQLKFSDRKTHSGRIIGNRVIEMSLSKSDPAVNKSIRSLLSRIVAQDYKPEITRRVLELNHLYFKQPIKSVNLKHNATNWGSCSNKSNLNFSTRLLFAPQDVIDYVIIHELAHLIELNHSPRFWKLVADAMPEYREKEEWLKVNRALCEF
ncbi:MAG: M48 family metallopeptidase, partial [Saprospiraceae bacterium]